MLVWVNPRECQTGIYKMRWLTEEPKRVDEWPDDEEKPFWTLDNRKFWACVEHFGYGVPWEKTGVIRHYEETLDMLRKGFDGMWSREDVAARYYALDEVFKQAKSEGRLRPQSEVEGSRDPHDIGVYFRPDGQPVFAWSGIHRFVIGFVLNIPAPMFVHVYHAAAEKKVLRRADAFRKQSANAEIPENAGRGQNQPGNLR